MIIINGKHMSLLKINNKIGCYKGRFIIEEVCNDSDLGMRVVESLFEVFWNERSTFRQKDERKCLRMTNCLIKVFFLQNFT